MTDPSEIHRILERPHTYRWTLQGFGMLRMYLTEDESVRLHVWSHADAKPGVSTIHDHPWDFTSEVISGVVRNVRHRIADAEDAARCDSATYWTRGLVCGPGGCLLGESERVLLLTQPAEVYEPGDTYSQTAVELHESIPSDGAVTVITRRFGPDRDRARVCWPLDKGRDGWVSAEPREATAEEVERITGLALERWAPRRMRPSDIVLLAAPLRGLTGDRDVDVAVAIFVHALATNGDTWRTITHEEIAYMLAQVHRPDAPERLRYWCDHYKPTIAPLEHHGLVERSVEGVAFTSKGLGALRCSKWCRPWLAPHVEAGTVDDPPVFDGSVVTFTATSANLDALDTEPAP